MPKAFLQWDKPIRHEKTEPHTLTVINRNNIQTVVTSMTKQHVKKNHHDQ